MSTLPFTSRFSIPAPLKRNRTHFKRWRIRPETETGDKIYVRGIPEYRMEFGQNYLVLTLGGYKKKDVPIFL